MSHIPRSYFTNGVMESQGREAPSKAMQRGSPEVRFPESSQLRKLLVLVLRQIFLSCRDESRASGG